MNVDPTISQGVARYLDSVSQHLGDKTLEEQREILADLESHIYEALAARAQGRQQTPEDWPAVLAEMDAPESYAEALTPETSKRRASTSLVVLGLLCSGLQIAGLGAIIAGVRVVGAIVGFAAGVNFFVIWSNRRSPKWLIRLTAVAAICGLGIIIIEIIRAL